MDLDEIHILEAIRNGSQSEFEKLFRAWYKPLCAHSFGFLQSRDEAEEVVQQVFINFWDKRAQIVIDTSFKSYLYRSVRNQSLNVLKHEKVKRGHAEFAVRNSQQTTDGSVEMMKEELQQRISDALLTLPEQCRLVFKMSRYGEMKYGEIAEELGISIKTVENHMGKALKLMREELKEYLPLILILMNGFL